jgi:hypothetical protein
MAKMFPPYNHRSSASRTAEPIVYKRLSEQLSDEFTVIHSLPWLGSAASEIDGRPVLTGEIDFLIFHQDLGILAIEVKGGKFIIDKGEFFVKRKNNKNENSIQLIKLGEEYMLLHVY